MKQPFYAFSLMISGLILSANSWAGSPPDTSNQATSQTTQVISSIQQSTTQSGLSLTLENNPANINSTEYGKLYAVIKGTNPNTKKPTFIRFDASQIGQYADIDRQLTPEETKQFSVDVSEIQNGQLLVPNLESGRVYLSFKEPVQFFINDKLGIADPVLGDHLNDQIIWDKVEFTYNKNGSTFINPTSVDNITMPVTVTQAGKVYGIDTSRAEMLKTIESVLNESGEGTRKEWTGLLKYLNDDINSGQVTKVLAAGRGNYFDRNYLDNMKDYGYSYIDNLKNYYAQGTDHYLFIDASELKRDSDLSQSCQYSADKVLLKGQVVGDNFEFKTNCDDAVYKVSLNSKDSNTTISNQFFLADQGTFSHVNRTVKAIIVRNMTAAWSVGLLPAPDQGADFDNANPLGGDYYKAHKSDYCKTNITPGIDHSAGPWFNLYSCALHAVSDTNYATPYDDALGQDGTNGSHDTYPVTIRVADMNL